MHIDRNQNRNGDGPPERLELDSRLSELTRVQPWIDALADEHGAAEDVRFAIQLCMEEALANVVLHGYRNEPGHPLVIQSSVSADTLFFTIEDEAPPFAPVNPGPRDAASSLDSIQPGGNGIRLLHRFAGSVDYERCSEGNRLTLGFPLSAKDVSA